MATDRVDYVHEKDATSIESAQVHSGNTDHNLAHERSVEDIDVYNTRAVKGDDSDGKVDWSLRSKFAAFFLAGLYTGMHTT
jgi:fibrillarin-like rRNA methylase